MLKNIGLGMLVACAVLALNAITAKADEAIRYHVASHAGGEYMTIEFDHNKGFTIAGAVQNWESNPSHHNYSKGKSLARCQLEWQVDSRKNDYYLSRYSCIVLQR